MAKLQHPHILRCYGGNLEGNNPFIVTELCECSLDKVRAESTLSLLAAIESDFSAGLVHSHSGCCPFCMGGGMVLQAR
jgi:hypothetical protein